MWAGIIAMVIVGLITLVAIIADPQADEPMLISYPPMPAYAPAISEEQEWSEYHAEAYEEYCDEFTALFNSYNYKLSRNGRSMINGKFVKMGV